MDFKKVAKEIDMDWTFHGRLTKQELREFDKSRKTKEAAAKAVVGTTILASTIGTSYTVNKGNLFNTDQSKNIITQSIEGTKETIQNITPNTKVASEQAYGPETIDFQGKTENGNDLVGILDEEEASETKDSMLRPVQKQDVEVIHTSSVKEDKDGNKEFEPFVTYNTSVGAEVFAPGDGEVIEINDVLVISHKKDGKETFSVIKGLKDFEVKKGDKVKKAQFIGKVKSSVGFAVAKGFSDGEAFNFIHPNMFVDIEKSDSFKYGTYKYYSKPAVKAASSAVGTEVEKEVEEAPEVAKESEVLDGVEIENKQQAELLKVDDEVFYSNEILPVEVIKNGKANVSKQVRALEPLIRAEAKKQGVEDMTEFLLALLQHESGGIQSVLDTDPMQASQSYNGKIGSIKAQELSIEHGVKVFVERLKESKMFKPLENGDVRIAIQSYNFGPGLSREADKDNVGYSVSYIQEKAKEFYEDAQERGIQLSQLPNEWRGEFTYGDFTYVAKIFQYFDVDKDWKKNALAAEKSVRNAIEAEEQKAKEKVEAEKENEKVKDAPKEKDKDKDQEESKDKELKKDEKKDENKLSKEDRIIKDAYETASEKINKIKGIQKPLVEALPDSDVMEGKVIVIDAGHGGHDSGAMGVDDDHTTEAELNLALAKNAAKKLEAQGATVIMTRTDDTFLSLGERAKISNDNNADAFVSFHNNSTGVSENLASGSETLYQKGSNEGKALAEHIQKYQKVAMKGTPNRGVVPRNLHVLRENERPSVLLESGFLIDPYSLELLKSDVIQDGITNAVVRGLVDYLELDSETDGDTEQNHEEQDSEEEQGNSEDAEGDKEAKEKKEEEEEEEEEVEKESPKEVEEEEEEEEEEVEKEEEEEESEKSARDTILNILGIGDKDKKEENQKKEETEGESKSSIFSILG